jgi:serine/threonine protein phosphatase PrpC
MNVTVVQETRPGRRPYNQDRLGCWRTPESLLMVLADGMGGHAHGEVAAELTMRHIAAAFRRDARPRLADPDLFLFRAVGRSHGMLHREAANLALPETPRTTVVACVVQDGHAWWQHVGDSRFYLLRKGQLHARTRDHTLVQELVDAGRLQEDAVRSHPARNQLLQCLGGLQPPRVEPTSRARLERDDLLLLCSDGLWGPLTQRQLLEGLASAPLADTLPRLVALAEEQAGPGCDNISAMALAWGEDAVAEAAAPRPVASAELSTVAQDFGATDPDFLRMTDEDIERAIAEIKAALKRHKPPR